MSARQRIVAGTVAQLSWQAVDQDGEPSDPGTTTVGVVGSDGSIIVAAGSATSTDPDDASIRTVSIPAQAVDQLTATWSGASASGTTTVDVVGGVYFTTAELRAAEATVSVIADFPTALCIEKRLEVETVFEDRTGTAFVPRFKILTPDRRGLIGVSGLRSIRWLQYWDGTFIDDATTIAQATEISASWVRCQSSIAKLGVVVGFDRPPADVIDKSMLYARHLLTGSTSGIDMRVLAQSAPDGSMVQLASPGRSFYVTGLPEIDEVLKNYKDRTPPRPVSVGWSR